MSVPTPFEIAKALCKANVRTGKPYNKKGTSVLTLRQRSQNLIDIGYVVGGDPYGWGGKHSIATILMEPKGGRPDCEPPMDYYGDGMEVSFRASDFLKTHYIEFINAAVACVYRA
jgi:hypothetical protein